MPRGSPEEGPELSGCGIEETKPPDVAESSIGRYEGIRFGPKCHRREDGVGRVEPRVRCKQAKASVEVHGLGEKQRREPGSIAAAESRCRFPGATPGMDVDEFLDNLRGRRGGQPPLSYRL